MTLLRRAFASILSFLYRVMRPIIFRMDAQTAHKQVIAMLDKSDQSAVMSVVVTILNAFTFTRHPVTVGSQTLRQRTILAAGFVKGYGFKSEDDALQAVESGKNIIPGWKIMPRLVGLVEFGSFTRYPRVGNPGTVIWRNAATQSTQNRIGLKNPGAVAAAEFLQRHIVDLPAQFGINIAVSPGVDDDAQAANEIAESIDAFLSRNVVPNWLTLNLSCPNTEDDPSGNQTATKTRHLCKAALQQIEASHYSVPLWVKVSPDLAESQYQILIRIFAELGVQAVIATNTLGAPTPTNADVTAGIGGGDLHPHALRAASILQREVNCHDYPVKIIGCGGIMDTDSYLRYKAHGIDVVQYWSAMIYHGPLVAAVIESDVS